MDNIGSLLSIRMSLLKLKDCNFRRSHRLQLRDFLSAPPQSHLPPLQLANPTRNGTHEAAGQEGENKGNDKA